MAGNGVLLWNLEINKKVRLHNHEREVQVIIFGSNSDTDRYLISIDVHLSSNIFISEWETMRRVHDVKVPCPKGNERKRPLKSVIASFDS